MFVGLYRVFFFNLIKRKIENGVDEYEWGSGCFIFWIILERERERVSESSWD